MMGSKPELLSVDDALELLLTQALPLTEVVQVNTAEALGRVLARDLQADADVPGWDNSAMDGYALRVADMQAEPPTRLWVSQRIATGRVGTALEAGTAVRIFTGAPVPAGADTVVMQEHCSRDGEYVEINVSSPVGKNIRRAGEDVRQGDLILQAGVRLLPQHLGMAASSGFGRVPVYRPLKVAILSTGDELVPADTALGPGQIHDSNRHCFLGLLAALGCRVEDLGLIPDRLDATREAIEKAAASADLVLSSGGVSVGEEDHVKAAVEALGRLQMWRVAIRPGKPLAFGEIGGVPFFGLPGNPVAMFVTFCIFVRPFILACQGRNDILPRCLHVPAGFSRDRVEKSREYMRARMCEDAHGTNQLQLYHSRSSGVLSSLTWADGLAILKENTVIQEGDCVDYLPFSTLLS